MNDSLSYSRKAFAWYISSSLISVFSVTSRGRGCDIIILSHPEQMHAFKQIVLSLIKEMYASEIVADKKEFISL